MRLWSVGRPVGMSAPAMGRLTTTPGASERNEFIAYVTPGSSPAFNFDFRGYVAALYSTDPPREPTVPAIISPPNLDYLRDGDVVQLFPNGTVQVLYRRSSNHNTILATERCNSLCLMCSQPPKDV